jgi:polysaccharide pyruvyl transferase WcaK-like protein
MHLAIAALGMNVPVMAATYQGKFEGLFHHFGLDDKYLLTPDRFLSQEMIDTFSMFVEELPILSQQVAEKMPEVLEKSKLNLADE